MQSIERDLRLTRIGLKDAMVLLDLGGTLYEVRQDLLSAIYKDGDIIYRKLSKGRRIAVHRRMLPRLKLFVLSVDDNKEGLRVVNTERDLLETKIDRLGEEITQLYRDKENLSMQVTGVSEEARMWKEKYESLKRDTEKL
ncbi:hypothetical protein [Bacillus cereus]|uniref:hypothetical protein n=1 Tax=Bacillus cereus TaxID=1396 RepID=UPI001C8C6686|nr:hypothetical protein [Bacillus cereus]MBX9158727.1 hypothetical protein [Bacillus cereus]